MWVRNTAIIAIHTHVATVCAGRLSLYGQCCVISDLELSARELYKLQIRISYLIQTLDLDVIP